jgi:dienelactone hydrolase
MDPGSPSASDDCCSKKGMKKAVGAIVLAFLSGEPFSSRAQTEQRAHFDIPRTDVLVDESIPITVSGLPPNATTIVRLRGGAGDAWTSNATFIADANGQIDVARMTPVHGRDYKERDAMGLFWSAEQHRDTGAIESRDDDDAPATPESWTLSAEVNGETVARTTLRRRAVAGDVRVTPVRASGLVGAFYEPPGGARHPAMVVLGGSGGGIPPPGGAAGGLASRGYAVLALAYFNAPGLPRTLSNVPLEYFGTAFDWLAAQASVDPDRIGVVGASRGAELALLIGVLYPRIRVVVAYMPSNVVWRGCCDMSTRFAWTIGGRPVATMPPPGRRDPAEAQRAEIQVERIHGPLMLISGRDDGVWDSAEMAGKIVARLKQHNFGFPYESLVYGHAGHGINRPYTSTMELNSRRHPLTGRTVHMGGTPSGTAKAREESWSRMLAFVEAAMSPRRSQQ